MRQLELHRFRFSSRDDGAYCSAGCRHVENETHVAKAARLTSSVEEPHARVPWLELPATDQIVVGSYATGCDGQMAKRCCIEICYLAAAFVRLSWPARCRKCAAPAMNLAVHPAPESP